MRDFFGYKKGQISFFVIIAILLVAGISFIFIFKPFSGVPSKLQPVEDYFTDCVSNLAEEGAMIAGEQGGHIDLPEFELGSEYMPSGSQINYFGSVIPYWFYVSGNNIKKEQVPSIEQIEKQMSDYIAENINECSFEDFSDYSVMAGEEIDVRVEISDSSIDVKVDYPLTISYKDGTSKRVTEHSARASSNLGYMYKKAKTIFEEEQERMFLEEYALDTLFLNAPTTGTELTCSPLTWQSSEIKTKVKDALMDNIRTIKLKGNYYSTNSGEENYFVYDTGEEIREQVNFFYSPLFPTRFEIEPEDEGLMMAMPVGIQEGLEMLGFCYVAYHFVYSLSFPVIVQMIDEQGNLFQFSTIVMIDKNKPKEADIDEAFEEYDAVLCKDERKIETLTLTTHDPYNVPVKSKISFKCLNSQCNIGNTELKSGQALFEGKVPQCLNGFLIASAEGYADTKLQISTNTPAIADMTLYKLYELDLDFEDLKDIKENEMVIISFASDDYTTTAVYPEQKNVKLKDGIYEIKAKLFRQGEIKLDKEITEKCIKVPETGLKGLLGLEREECYDIEIPEQTLTEILAGGGKTTIELNDYELSKAKKISVDVPEFETPKNIGDMQSIYVLSESSEVFIILR